MHRPIVFGTVGEAALPVRRRSSTKALWLQTTRVAPIVRITVNIGG